MLKELFFKKIENNRKLIGIVLAWSIIATGIVGVVILDDFIGLFGYELNLASLINGWQNNEPGYKPPPIIKKESENTAESKAQIDCSKLESFWASDGNITIENNKLLLKDGFSAGSVISDAKISSFSSIDIKFKSSLRTGINTALTIGRKDEDRIKYAIGDGDFETVRVSYINKEGVNSLRQEKLLKPAINNSKPMLLHIETSQTIDGFNSTATIKYNDEKDDTTLNTVHSINPKSRISLWLGVNRQREPETKEAYIEIISCTILEKDSNPYL